jgi:hypothetical protein
MSDQAAPTAAEGDAFETTVVRAHELALDLARQAGGILRDRLDAVREIAHKGTIDLVTDADHASEALIRFSGAQDDRRGRIGRRAGHHGRATLRLGLRSA